MKTPNQIEKALHRGAEEVRERMHRFPERYGQFIHEAEQTFRMVRRSHGLESKATLLSGDISKLNKDGAAILGLALLPATTSKIGNVCAFADSCATTCVAFSGNGSFSNTVKARMARTDFMINHPREFIELLTHEIFQHINWNQKSEPLAIRLNTYSDIRWERVFPWFFTITETRVQFYDYTKHTPASRPESTRPKNYHWTYSVSEKTTTKVIDECAEIGRPLAVVVAIRSGVLPNTDEMRPIPRTWGNFSTVDGDATDARWKTEAGQAVILRRKYTMKEDHPMIVKAAKLETTQNNKRTK